MQNSEQFDLTKTFWRWFSLSVLALMVAAAIPALSADVFIDEGDSDFNAATPVSTPVAAAVSTPQVSIPAAAEASADKKPASVDATNVNGGKAPASEDPSSAGSDLDSSIGELESPRAGQPGASDLNMPNDPPPLIEEKPVKKSTKKTETKSGKKSDKKKSAKPAKKAKQKSDKKKSNKKKKDQKKSNKKLKKESAANETEATRQVATYAGGKYETTSKDCAMESAPGAGDSVGTARASRKLWIEDAGNTSYWKVFGKNGNAAYVSRDCF